MPPSEITATSDVPPPMSTTMLPVGSPTGRPAPIAAAIGSSIRYAWRAPADRQASSTARFSTPVTPDGHADDDARVRPAVLVHLLDEVAQHLLGHVEVGDHAVLQRPDGARSCPGVRPSIRLASMPTAWTSPVRESIATTRRLGQHDAAAAHVDERVGGAEVDRHVTAAEAGEVREEAHAWATGRGRPTPAYEPWDARRDRAGAVEPYRTRPCAPKSPQIGGLDRQAAPAAGRAGARERQPDDVEVVALDAAPRAPRRAPWIA